MRNIGEYWRFILADIFCCRMAWLPLYASGQPLISQIMPDRFHGHSFCIE
jgi:hypothetical protein